VISFFEEEQRKKDTALRQAQDKLKAGRVLKRSGNLVAPEKTSYKIWYSFVLSNDSKKNLRNLQRF